MAHPVAHGITGILHGVLKTSMAHIADSIAAQRLAEIKTAGIEKCRFAWAGSTKPGVGHTYRVEGPTFVLELINVQSDPAGNVANHIHSVWRSLKHDFGLAAK